MPQRAPSPARSENEVDISKSLVESFSDSEAEDIENNGLPTQRNLPQGKMPEFNLDDSSDDDDFIAKAQTASNRKNSNLKGRTVKKGGGFQAMGLSANLLKAITRKGFSVPTPIQRKTIPPILAGQDVVGMARTGSGKTAAFVIPMIENLKSHSAKVGARALIMSPSRELALQILKVVKEFGKGTDLRCILLVGGDSMEEQFNLMASNPDIVIATPGRFLHLKVEMGLDLSSIRYAVFDEADRLFEMGFADQLTEILHALPSMRQTLLFSATLPKSLVEFARAGLQEPTLIRLDAESKISPDLQSAFFSLKTADKEGALLHMIQNIIKIPTGQTEAAAKAKRKERKDSKKRKRGEFEEVKTKESPTEHSTIVFTATKHHVDYIASFLRLCGYTVSHVYGSLDQTARKIQVQDFRTGMTNILVVTDVAARGIDIPILANVINYDFPAQPKIFVHRVGRTARAGQRGWSYSLVSDADVPYLLDLQLFLGKRLVVGRSGEHVNYAEDIAVGSLVKDEVGSSSEWITKILNEDDDIAALRSVAAKGEKLYLRTRNSASSESAKRAKAITSSKHWAELHPLFNNEKENTEVERERMLARVSSFRPQETIFELGKRGAQGEAGEVIKKRRTTIEARKKKLAESAPRYESDNDPDDIQSMLEKQGGNSTKPTSDVDMDSASEEELEITFSESQPDSRNPRSKKTSRDDSVYMSYTPQNINQAEDRGYGVHSGSYSTSNPRSASFLTDARSAMMDLDNDEGSKAFAEPSKTQFAKRWDKKSKKYVSRANDEDGSKGSRMIVGESGAKIAASFRSGRFDAWKKANRISRLPRVGDMETTGGVGGAAKGGNRWKHRKETAPKAADKFRDNYYKQKKKVNAAKERRIGSFKDGEGKREIKAPREVQKERMEMAKKREKTGRHKKGRKS